MLVTCDTPIWAVSGWFLLLLSFIPQFVDIISCFRTIYDILLFKRGVLFGLVGLVFTRGAITSGFGESLVTIQSISRSASQSTIVR